MDNGRDVGSWIEWAAGLVRQADPIPNVAEPVDGAPWDELILEWAQDVATDESGAESVFREVATYALAAPYQVAPRFVALRIVWGLRSELCRVMADDGLGEFLRDTDYPCLDEAVAGLSRVLADVVHLVAAGDCPREWPILRWEISNSALVGDAERADAILGLVPSLGALPEAGFLCLRAHVSFLRVFWPRSGNQIEDDENASTMWPPALSSLGLERFQALLLFGIARCGERRRELTTKERLLVRDVAHDLEKAADIAGHLGVAYRMALARACFELGRFPEAAGYYDALIRDPGVKDVWLEQDDGPGRWEIARCAAYAWLNAGDAGAAEARLKDHVGAAKDKREALITLAKLQSEAGRFDQTYETVRQLEAIGGDQDRDWREKSLLALGNIAASREDLRRRLDAVFDANQSNGAALRQIVAHYWPRYATLTERAQRRWIKATWYHYWPLAESQLRESVLEDTVAHYAEAVAMELRTRVFEVYRDYFRTQGKMRGPVPATEDRALRRFLDGGRGLTLGDMAFALESKSTGPIERDFSGWVRSHHPNLSRRAFALKSILGPRTNAVHGDADAGLADRVAAWCREVLEGIKP